MIFSPGVYEHAAALINRTPWEVSRSSDMMVEAHLTAWQRYRHPLIVTGIDVYNLEAEAYGAMIAEPRGNNVPAISRHAGADVEALSSFPVLEPLRCERIQAVLKAGQTLRKECREAKVHIPVCGPFTLAIGLIGMSELLMGLVEEREELEAGLKHLLRGQIRFVDAIHKAGLRPIIFESGTAPPLLPVKDFVAIEAPLLKQLFGHVRSLTGEAPPCIIGGDAVHIAKPFLEAGPGFVINPSETDQLAFMKVMEAFPDVHVRVNIPGSLLLDGDFGTIQAQADAAIALALTRANTSVGCGVIPFEANPDTVCRLRDYIESHPAQRQECRKP